MAPLTGSGLESVASLSSRAPLAVFSRESGFASNSFAPLTGSGLESVAPLTGSDLESVASSSSCAPHVPSSAIMLVSAFVRLVCTRTSFGSARPCASVLSGFFGGPTVAPRTSTHTIPFIRGCSFAHILCVFPSGELIVNFPFHPSREFQKFSFCRFPSPIAESAIRFTGHDGQHRARNLHRTSCSVSGHCTIISTIPFLLTTFSFPIPWITVDVACIVDSSKNSSSLKILTCAPLSRIANSGNGFEVRHSMPASAETIFLPTSRSRPSRCEVEPLYPANASLDSSAPYLHCCWRSRAFRSSTFFLCSGQSLM